MKRVAAVAFAVAFLWGRLEAWALCPNCLGQEPTLSPTLGLVGLFLLVPPAVFFAVARAIRALERGEPVSEVSQRASPAAPASPPSAGAGGDQAGCASSDVRRASAAGVPRSATSDRT